MRKQNAAMSFTTIAAWMGQQQVVWYWDLCSLHERSAVMLPDSSYPDWSKRVSRFCKG